MKWLFLALVVLVVACAIYGLVLLASGRIRLPGWAARPQRPFYTDTSQQPDGSTIVQIRREGEPPRTVKELPPAMDPIDFRLELEEALDEADEQVRVLNRRR